MTSSLIINILKIRDDTVPVKFSQQERDGEFRIMDGQRPPSWLSNNISSVISKSDLRHGIEPWLTSLFQSEHLSLLIGSGLSTALEIMASGSSSNAMSKPRLNSIYSDKVEAAAQLIAKKNNRGESNVEDYIRVLNELVRGLEILGHDDSPADDAEKTEYRKLHEELGNIILEFANAISAIENNIAVAPEDKRLEAFDYMVNFLMSFASRTGTRERLNIFTTNYDRLIEAGSEVAGLHLLDRFAGTLAPIFRSSRLDVDLHYNPPGIRGEPRYLEGVARFTKLHGSIDWVNTGSDIRRIGLPLGSSEISSFLNAPGIAGLNARTLMIYPNSAKDRETAEYPYVELFRDFASAVCRPNSTIVTFGYGFGDDHINRVIRDMLTIPSTHLVIISYDEANGRIMEKYREFSRPSQISLIVGNGVADLKTLVDYYLPKPSIDRASLRMSELLKQRYSTSKIEETSSNGGEVEK